jgi:hypothetical protein
VRTVALVEHAVGESIGELELLSLPVTRKRWIRSGRATPAQKRDDAAPMMTPVLGGGAAGQPRREGR